MSSSTQPRFLLDENVRVELEALLRERGIDFALVEKGTGDKRIATISLSEDRVVVSNDRDFSRMCQGEVFGVVWLRIPQKDVDRLIREFDAMLTEKLAYADSLVVLEPGKRHASPLFIRA